MAVMGNPLQILHGNCAAAMWHACIAAGLEHCIYRCIIFTY